MPKPEKILAQELLELEVLDLSRGETLGSVVDFAIARDGRVVQVGLLPVRWFSGGLGVAPGGISSVSQDCICLAANAELSPFAPDEQDTFSVYFGQHIQGKPVLQEDGALLGELVDFAFSLDDGRILDLVVEDNNDKRIRVPVEAFRTIGRDYVVIQRAGSAPASQAAEPAKPAVETPVQEPVEQTSGLPADDPVADSEIALEEEAAPLADLLPPPPPVELSRAEEKAALFSSSETAGLAKFDQKKRDFLRGRKAHRDISTPGGELIAAKGAALDDAKLEQIIQAGLLGDIFIEMTLTKK